MKVVLFCGGFGTRIREQSESTPKPLVKIGYRPIIWHLMKYYDYFGYNDFILCLGYKADDFKNYFLNYVEALSNDFILSAGNNQVQLLNHDLKNWRITFVDTGLHANIGQRLKAVKKHLEGEDVFMANYSDGLTDLYLPKMVDYFNNSNKTACFLSVNPSQSFHIVSLDEKNVVTDISPVQTSNMLINGGFFIFKNDIFKYMKDGEELVLEPFQRLIGMQELISYKHNGFWACMDTFKEKQYLEDLYTQGKAPWEVWKQNMK